MRISEYKSLAEGIYERLDQDKRCNLCVEQPGCTGQKSRKECCNGISRGLKEIMDEHR